MMYHTNPCIYILLVGIHIYNTDIHSACKRNKIYSERDRLSAHIIMHACSVSHEYLQKNLLAFVKKNFFFHTSLYYNVQNLAQSHKLRPLSRTTHTRAYKDTRAGLRGGGGAWPV